MADLGHWFGGDLGVSASGDLLLADQPYETQQRIVRRLLTNPGGYLWQPPYGAGLPAFVGRPGQAARIAAIARTQATQESEVAASPLPAVSVTSLPGDTYSLTLTYTPAWANASQTLTLPLS